MGVHDLISWGRGRSQVPAPYRDEDANPFLSLHREVNRLFDDVFRGFNGRFSALAPFGTFGSSWPSIEVSETDKAIVIAAEMPGLEEKDIEVLLQDGVLTLRGEKRSETEDKDRQFSERYYGRFERRIPVGTEIDDSKVEAVFKNGLLKVTLPKTETAQSHVKRIEIRS